MRDRAAAAAGLAAAVVVFWRVRRRQRAAAPGAWMEATCPACIGVSLLAAGLTASDPASQVASGPDDESEVLVR